MVGELYDKLGDGALLYSLPNWGGQGPNKIEIGFTIRGTVANGNAIPWISFSLDDGFFATPAAVEL